MTEFTKAPSNRFSRRTDWRLQPNSFTQAQREMLASGREVLDLTLSNPTRAGFAYDSKAILEALCNPSSLDYDPQPRGLLSARSAIANYYRTRPNSAKVDPDAIVLTTSTSEGYSYVMRLLANPGDEILVPRPSYPLFEFLADLQDVKLAPYQLIYDHGWQIDFDSVRKATSARTRAAIVVHPNNPTGSYVSSTEQQQLNDFFREREIALMVDEVFLDYALDEVARPSFAANQEVLTFTLSGLSKISALPQMKVAWIATSGPEELVSAALARLEVIADTYLSMNAPLQLAIPVLLEQKSTIQPQLLERVRANLSELDSGLAAHPACRRLQVEGGWYAVLRVPVTQADNELAIALLREQAVLVHPGHFYDFEREGHFVLSLITPPKQFREGVRRFLSSLQRTS
ncbi:MAG: pyridoxal phosphate-dependent aminotransferase [Acidobacteria bacterium]|nr:MAG: pyridoxal phosphate-dependent aminotransferase [Acidobacteriota bacterium]